MSTTMIGIVILNYQTWDDTKRCIESINQYAPKEPYQIILVDNASPNSPTYSLEEMLENYHVEYICSDRNRGYNGGNNLGIQKARQLHCDCVLITNNDICFREGSIQTMWEYLQKHPDTGIVGPKILDREGNVQHSNLCRKTGVKEKYLLRTRLHAVFRQSYRSYFGFDRDYDSTFPVHAVLGCCFLMSKQCVEAVTPLDEYPFLYEEELILGIHMEEAGLKTVYLGDAEVEHLHGGSTRWVKAFSYAHNIRSELYYCRRYLHMKKWQVLPLYYYRVFLYLLRCLRYQDFRKQWFFFREITREELGKYGEGK